MTRFPTSGHLASWTKFTPGVSESAGKKKGKNATSHGAPYLARVLGAAARRRGPHRFLSRRALPADRPPRGQKKPSSRSVPQFWSSLAPAHRPQRRYDDLGADVYDSRVSNSHQMRSHVRQFEALGYQVTL